MIERTIVSKRWIKQLHTLSALHFNRCLRTECIETTAHFNGNFDTDKQIYVPNHSDFPSALYTGVTKNIPDWYRHLYSSYGSAKHR
jgi:hypothetical protein